MRVASTASVIAVGVAAIVVLAVVVGRGAAERPEPTGVLGTSPPAAATSPSATATNASSPSPTPSPRGVLDSAFGFAVFESGRARIRSETSDAEVSLFALQMPSYSQPAVSPDGRSVAYWEPATGTPVLHVRPGTGGTARTVLKGKDRQVAGRVAWSSDGIGLVAGLQSDGPRPELHSLLVSEIWTVDLATGATEQIASRGDGGVWVPVAWDRHVKLVAAGLTGEGGHMTSYELVLLGGPREERCDPATPCPYPIRATPIAPPYYFIFGLIASADARFVLLTTPGYDILWWPLAEPQKRSRIASEAGAARWRPGTSEIWWIGGRSPSGCLTAPCAGTELISFDVATGARTVEHRGTYGPYLQGFRVDGSAAMTTTEGPGVGSGPSEITVVELDRGRTERVKVSGGLGMTVLLGTPAARQTTQQRTVRLYYYSSAQDTDDRGNVLCSEKGVVAVERQIPSTQTPIQDSIRLLLKGQLTAAERARAITTEFPLVGLELREASLQDGVLTLTFADPNWTTTGGACRTGILAAQVRATAQQFEGVRQVVFRPLDLFQP